MTSFQPIAAETASLLTDANNRVKTALNQEVPADFDRNESVEKIRLALNHKQVREMLIERGYSPDQAENKLATMTDQQIHTLATASDELADGGILGTIALVLIIVLLVILILRVTDASDTFAVA